MKNSNRAALYLRISKEDEISGAESESIAAQRMLLRDFVNQQEELKTCTLLEFVDDGYSGTSFHRPGVTFLLDQVKKNEINCILVKDFSRFGRNYLEVGNYIEQIFPFLGVRFISVNDQYDSFKKHPASGSLDVAFKNILYDIYSKDLSQKVTSARKSMAEQGKFFSAFAPYGYVKEKGNQSKLAIDPECAPVVKRIFHFYVEGATKTEIARILNEEQVPSPMMVKKMRNEKFSRYQCKEKCHWRASMISKILSDERYTGNLIYRKTAPECIGSSRDKKVPKKDWIVVPDTHEAIIGQQLFQQARQTIGAHNYKRNPSAAPLAGKVRCPFCGHCFVRKGKKEAVYFRCTTWHITHEYDCFQGGIKEKELEEAVFLFLKKLVSLETGQTEIKDGSREQKQQVLPQQHSREYERWIQRKKQEKYRLYEEYKAGKISIGQWKQHMEKIESEIREKEEEMPFLPSLDPFSLFTKKMADELVKGIDIKNDREIKIKWNFRCNFFIPSLTA